MEEERDYSSEIENAREKMRLKCEKIVREEYRRCQTVSLARVLKAIIALGSKE